MVEQISSPQVNDQGGEQISEQISSQRVGGESPVNQKGESYAAVAEDPNFIKIFLYGGTGLGSQCLQKACHLYLNNFNYKNRNTEVVRGFSKSFVFDERKIGILS